MRRVAGPCRLPTASRTDVGRQNGKTRTPSTRESVASTEAPSPSTFIFGAETVITNHPIPSDDGQHHPADAFNFAMAAASRHAHAKRTSRTPAPVQPRWSSSPASRPTGDGKRQKTASAREDPCCPCSILSTCSERNCPCAKARRPGEIATQAMDVASIQLPPTTQPSVKPIANISRVPQRRDFAPAWASRRAR